MRSCGWRGSRGRRVEGSAKWGKNTFKRGREGKDDGRAALGSFARGPGRPPHPAALRGPRVLRGWLRNGGQPLLDTRPPCGARGGREARFPQQRVRTRPAASNSGGARPALVNRLRLRKTKGSSARRQPFACEPCRGRRGASPGITSPARAVGRTETLAINPAVRAASAWRLTAPLQRAFLLFV